VSDKNNDRLGQITSQTIWDPKSLVGSYFHAVGGEQWQGCVVAEPHPGFYLVELFDWVVGDSSRQRLVKIEDMLTWHFYDNAKWMNNAYEARNPFTDEPKP
jgi:hypothetical protein